MLQVQFFDICCTLNGISSVPFLVVVCVSLQSTRVLVVMQGIAVYLAINLRCVCVGVGVCGCGCGCVRVCAIV